MDVLVSTEWLAERIDDPDLSVVDATWFLPGTSRDARAEYEAAHIPGAVFIDLGELCANEEPVVGKLPPDHKFASRMQAAGLGDGHCIVVYDNSPLHTAARGWFLLKAYGAREVAVLDGGLGKWTSEGRPVESGTPSPMHTGHFSAALDRSQVMTKEAVAALVHSDGHEIVDARGAARFAGEEAEPRPDVTPGHIPGACNLPYASLYNPDGTFKRGVTLRAAFDAAGVDLAKPMIATCGSGVTACSVMLAAALLGKDDMRLYDGSWAEWGADPAMPKATGRA
ncbi:3-mercaptopyruvate sulfurtransferase [Allosphingosinicella vermicomposti]|uniref:3-mercaptopyruvate sulfurtransferase n=1 Tax=Allosphingosinicella vermicomposti TaxID=614671 RepID=UPI000D10CAF1|nr:3-mercaptopyruvate sulfurtransferase [Allosphingosinicella vermicomposti]